MCSCQRTTDLDPFNTGWYYGPVAGNSVGLWKGFGEAAAGVAIFS